MKLRGHKHQTVSRRGTDAVAFTLVEVMIAVAIFFMAMFSILGVLSTELHAASILRSSSPTAGMVASELSIDTLSNNFDAMSGSGDFGEIASYEGYRYQWVRSDAATNGLLQFDIVVYDPSGKPGSVMSVLFYRPQLAKSSLGLH